MNELYAACLHKATYVFIVGYYVYVYMIIAHNILHNHTSTHAVIRTYVISVSNIKMHMKNKSVHIMALHKMVFIVVQSATVVRIHYTTNVNIVTNTGYCGLILPTIYRASNNEN